MPPHFLELSEKGLVVLDVSELIRILVVALEIPVRWRRNNQVNRLILQEGQVPRVSVDESVTRCFHRLIRMSLHEKPAFWQIGPRTDPPNLYDRVFVYRGCISLHLEPFGRPLNFFQSARRLTPTP